MKDISNRLNTYKTLSFIGLSADDREKDLKVSFLFTVLIFVGEVAVKIGSALFNFLSLPSCIPAKSKQLVQRRLTADT